MLTHPKYFKPCPWRNVWFAPLAIGLTLLLSSGTVFAVESIFNDQSDDQAVLNYWTPQRMQEAVPPEMGRGPEPGANNSSPQQNPWPKDAKPGYSPGWKPGSGPQPDPQKLMGITPENRLFKVTTGGGLPLTHAPFSPPSSPTDYVNYAPFDRHTWYGRYLAGTMAPIGKLFFTAPDEQTYVCTASVIGRRTIVTAAHCLRTGDEWNTNFMFCPSYNRGSGSGAPNPARGCWGWSRAAVSSAYHDNRATDRDYGCIVTAPTNPTTGQQVGDVTGWTGRTWNLSHKQHIFSFGYPAESPFPDDGYHIVSCASSEWYQVNMSANDGTVDQVSKYIGCDQTGGSSGGPWWIGILHPNRSDEYPAVDTSQETDPRQGMGGPFLNGLNSQRRCTEEGCPPGTVYLSEMGSPQFRSTSGDTDESEDVFQACISFESGPPYPNRVIDTISVGNSPRYVAVTPDGNYVYVSNAESNTVSVIQTSDNTVIDTIPVGWLPLGIAVTPNGGYVYVANGFGDTVSMIRTSDNTVVETIPVENHSFCISVTPNGNFVYLASYEPDRVIVIRTSDNTVVETIPVGNDPIGVAVTPNGNYAYVTSHFSPNDDLVSVIRTSDNTVVETIPVGVWATGLTVTPNGNYVYVSNSSLRTVSVIQTSDNTVIDTIPVGYANYVAVTPNGNYVYVTNGIYGYDYTLSVIQTSDNTVIDTISLGDEPSGVVVTPGGSSVYVAHPRNNTVSVIGF